MKKNKYFNEIEKIYKEMSPHLKERLKEFKNIWENGSNKDIHLELSFCILTPQSKALNAWQAITNLKKDDLIYTGKAEELVEFITKDFFDSLSTVTEKRDWIVKNIKGMSYKEASHFLRNVGFGESIAILDRHILKNLVKLEVIDELPKTLTPKLYLEIEEKMRNYCKFVKIPMDEMDLLLWYKEAGVIFK